VSLISRYLEANGVSTVVIGTARDIVEHCGVARFVFADFPLGSPCGEPENVAQQRTIFQMALDLLGQAKEPRTTVEAGFRWPGDDRWKELVFTEERPFLDEEATAVWEARKVEYKVLKETGKI